ncbi:polyketide cyclase / dehydrase and lipid transport [Rhodococcus sp. D2-41]|uniref:Polyketide cyclase / dehydrase and lipid transport n=1 Tax=Speluncibacter jeojiensis TaxID=2710754 RepID=A0A9X4LZK2_9ACTN|nr:polyketide cyclase / dehydrase and lipid transport [Rhodococcus sp. D2-41]MDG3011955.1 polyketide cyclase / dehydrase and lipid transport [Rhodococcus sp. D2-41]MDG3013407.1 polyketide cyclase / dehydrase and lipid transport [Corynebacteriales bacterium D3-21]
MSSIQVADQTFIAVPPEAVAAELADRRKWRRWWPDLALTVVEDRAEKGIRWTVAGPLTGTMELWLDPVLDGTMVNYFLHAEPVVTSAEQAARLDLAEMNRLRRVAGKELSFELKRRLEAGRAAGEEPPHVRAG